MILFVTIWQLSFFITFYFLLFGENLIDRTPPQKKKKLNKAHKMQFSSVYYTWNYYDKTSKLFYLEHTIRNRCHVKQMNKS